MLRLISIAQTLQSSVGNDRVTHTVVVVVGIGAVG